MMPASRWSLLVSGVSGIKLKIAYVVALILAAITLAVSIPKGVDTDLFSLVGDNGFVSQLAAKSSTIIRAIPLSDEAKKACEESGLFQQTDESEKFLEKISTHGKGLLGEKHREMLLANETNRIVRSAMRRNYVGVGLFPAKDDPYYFLNDFVTEFAWAAEDVRPYHRSTTRHLVGGDVLGAPILQRLLDIAQRGEIYLGGAPFHTFLATERTKREINALSIISLIAVLFLGWRLFGDLRFALPMTLALSSGLLIGAAVVFIGFEHPHALTFLFGTSLIGLGVDYCYHSLMARFAKTDSRDCLKSMTAALLTTALSFSPLLFSSISVLNQMAAFTIAGLFAIYIFVWLWFIR